MKYIKVGKCKLQEYYVTKLISEQFSKSWLDDLSRANLNKCVLQKVEEFLEPCNAPISNQCPRIWDWTLIFLILVTSLISEQFSKSWSDHLFLAKKGKHILQKVTLLLYIPGAPLNPWYTSDVPFNRLGSSRLPSSPGTPPNHLKMEC